MKTEVERYLPGSHTIWQNELTKTVYHKNIANIQFSMLKKKGNFAFYRRKIIWLRKVQEKYRRKVATYQSERSADRMPVCKFSSEWRSATEALN
jgi:hypothetical protein